MLDHSGYPGLRGPWLVTAITSVCSSGFLLFGYDQGVMSGVVISQNWLDHMDHPSSILTGTIVALYDVGAIFGALAAAFTCESLGRKRALLFGTLVLAVGTVLMGTSFERAQFMVSRIVTGLGIGYISSVTPVYQAEISKASQRGWQLSCQLSSLLLGLMLAYWVNYGFFFYAGSIQWRFPLLFQLVPAAFILAVTPWLPDTPRWVMSHLDIATGVSILARLRGLPESHAEVQREKDEIVSALQMEAEEEGSWGDLIRSNGIQANRRFYLALGITFMQQMTGINIVAYYSPTLFTTALSMSEEKSILMGCFLQTWFFIASFLTWFLIDRLGRRPLFMIMALGMFVVLVAEAVSVKIQSENPHNSHAAVAAVFFIFAFNACFTWGWMATVWVYPPEILPLKIRAKGAALATATDFLGNFLVVQVTPDGIENLGWKYYLIWAVFNLVASYIVWAFYPETGAQPLEAVDRLFLHPDDLSESNDPAGIRFLVKPGGLVGMLQWDVVAKADAQVKWYKRNGGIIEDREETNDFSGDKNARIEMVEQASVNT